MERCERYLQTSSSHWPEFPSSSNAPVPASREETEVTIPWFKSMISDFLSEYIEYLKHIGIEEAALESIENTPSNAKFGGAFAIAADQLIEAPSVFSVRFFPSGALLVQCGFYEYFVTVNVLTFAFQKDPEVPDTDFQNQCRNAQLLSHIVSCIIRLT